MVKKGTLKVFVVEDEVITAQALCLELKDLGCEVIKFVTSGEKAVAVALKEKPDLIFMDIGLSGSMDGFEAAKRIKREEDIPICFISGFATDQIKEKISSMELFDFLVKPITVKHMQQVLKKLV